MKYCLCTHTDTRNTVLSFLKFFNISMFDVFYTVFVFLFILWFSTLLAITTVVSLKGYC